MNRVLSLPDDILKGIFLEWVRDIVALCRLDMAVCRPRKFIELVLTTLKYFRATKLNKEKQQLKLTRINNEIKVSIKLIMSTSGCAHQKEHFDYCAEHPQNVNDHDSSNGAHKSPKGASLFINVSAEDQILIEPSKCQASYVTKDF